MTPPEARRTVMPTLIVDDDEEQRRLVVRLFERAGFGPIHEAADADDALAVAGREELAMVVLDLVMPGRTGLDVLPDLHDLVPDASIVVLSNLPRRRVGDVALARGATGYVEKRVAPDRLVTEILIAAAVAAATAERLSVRLPADPVAARTARGLLRDALSSLDRELLSSIELLVSELVTNAVLHASSAARLDVHVNRGSIRVEVFDDDTTLPAPREADAWATGGRGLQLVDRIASRWGSEAKQGGKVVWFEMDRAPTG
jgi:CheY-like chemotaxis protein